jgi:hypothetical protein
MFEIWKLERKRKNILRLYEPKLNKFHKEKKEEEIDRLLSEREWDLRPVEGQIQSLIGQRIIEEAEKLDVEIPPYDKGSGYWGWDGYSRLTYLTPRGRSYLRKLIDEEKARKFEVKSRWIKLLVPLVTALTGLIGVIIALLAVAQRSN